MMTNLRSLRPNLVHVLVFVATSVLAMLIFSGPVYAGSNNRTTKITTEEDCVGCLEKMDDLADDHLEIFDREISDIVSSSGALIQAVKEMKFDTICTEFSGKNDLGRWSRYAYDLLDPIDHANIFNGASDLSQNCPRYSRMDIDEKKHVWVLILTSMSFLESHCKTKAKNSNAPNGIANGILQLHKGSEGSYSKDCRNGDSETAQRSLRCAASMLDDQLGRDKELYSKKSYWDVLRPNGTGVYQVVQSALRTYHSCNLANSSSSK